MSVGIFTVHELNHIIGKQVETRENHRLIEVRRTALLVTCNFEQCRRPITVSMFDMHVLECQAPASGCKLLT